MNKRPMTDHKQLLPRRKPSRIKYIDTPPINNLHDLVEIGHSVNFYRNIDSLTLCKITPHIEELLAMVGMQELKDSIFYQILYYLQGMHLKNDSEEYLHTMIFGPPGTGKTTVAKIIAKIYQGLGILSPNASFRIAHRDDFIAGYLGQTAIKTQKLLKSCLGGVLFIDEVYSLAPRENDKDSFSKEALDILTAFLSEHKKDFCCIAAGYEDDIKSCFYGMNKGLQRRFPWVHRINEYTPEHLSEIFKKMISEHKWQIVHKDNTLVKFFEINKKLFPNAGGDIETFLSKCKMVHSKRVINMTPDHKFILTQEDLENAIEMVKKHKAKPIEDPPPPFGMYR
jgi:SpoVK/Ycf46/Vps4 family AAA+-type ATPase